MRVGCSAPPFVAAIDGEDTLSVWFERNGYAFHSSSDYLCERFQLLFFGTAAPLSLDVLRYPLPLNESEHVVIHHLGDYDEVAPGEIATWDTRGAQVGDEFVVRLRDDEGRVTYSEPGMVVSPEDSFPSRECTPRPRWTFLGALLAFAGLASTTLAVVAVVRGNKLQHWLSKARRIRVGDEGADTAPSVLPSFRKAAPRGVERSAYQVVDPTDGEERISVDEAEFVGSPAEKTAG
ncbi:hypothetical protein DMC30DRAFT_232779 [Rhodotorula diobovata]|uniref:Uncharacterized protein n=1 Tax=Rhodotorula diobovata TaxID=5288 RepID=A0A5C5FVH2_9BASI|nr:hypothetical protein DMC30DRAFT_232779 [Rhodotorula diobovata]